MLFKNKIAAALFGLVALPVAAFAAVIGGTYYAPQYDFGEFFAATDHRNFQVILAGNPFPGIDPNTVANALLPAMQAAKPRPALTFTYEAPLKGRIRVSTGAGFRFRARSGFGFGVPGRHPLQARPAGPLLSLRRLLPQRSADVRDDGLDTRHRSGRSADPAALPRTVPGRLQRLAGAAAAERPRGSVLARNEAWRLICRASRFHSRLLSRQSLIGVEWTCKRYRIVMLS